MKTFRKILKDVEAVHAGQARNKLFWSMVGGTKHEAPMRKLVRRHSLKESQYIYLHGEGACRMCKKPARWSARDNRYSNWCSSKCQNSDPQKLAQQQKTERKTKDARADELEVMRGSYVKTPKAPTEKHIAAFKRILATLATEVHEPTLVKHLPKALLPVWFNLNHDAFRYRKRIALGELPFQSLCKVCSEPVKCTSTGDWGLYCSHKCANEANRPARLSADARNKTTESLRKRFSDPHEIAKFQRRMGDGLEAKYGERNPSQIPHIARKQRSEMARTKKYMLGRREVRVQGYEPQALDILLTTLKPSQVHVESEGSVPSLRYKVGGVSHVHYPDIYIPHLKQLLEVKSTYTGMGSSEVWRRNKAKARAAVKQGYRYTIFLVNRNGDRVRLPNGWVRMSFKEISKWLKQYQAAA